MMNATIMQKLKSVNAEIPKIKARLVFLRTEKKRLEKLIGERPGITRQRMEESFSALP